MGWTAFRKPQDFDARQFAVDHFTTPTQSVLGIASGRGGYYLAVRLSQPGRELHDIYECDTDGSITLGVVLLCSTRDGEFAYKDMCETSGPAYHGCPDRILDELSKPRASRLQSALWLAVWREACRRSNARKDLLGKLRSGDVVTFSEALCFAGTTIPAGTAVTVAEKRGRTQLFRVDGIGLARIRSWRSTMRLPECLESVAPPPISALEIEDELRLYSGDRGTPRATLRSALERAVNRALRGELVSVHGLVDDDIGGPRTCHVLWYCEEGFGVSPAFLQESGEWSLGPACPAKDYCAALDLLAEIRSRRTRCPSTEGTRSMEGHT